MKRRAALLLLCALALHIAAALASPGYRPDTVTFAAWSSMLQRTGLRGFYSCGYDIGYFPGYLYILYLSGAVIRLLGVSWTGRAGLLILSAVPILCDLGLAAVLFREALPRLGARKALIVLCLTAFNPALLWDSCVWKQVDSVFVLFLLCAFLQLQKHRPAAAALLYGLALLCKPQALIFGPVFAVEFLLPVFRGNEAAGRMRALAKAILCAALSCGTVLLLTIPFSGFGQAFSLLMNTLSGTVGYFSYASVNAANLIAALGGNWQPESAIFLFLSWKTWGWIAIVLLTVSAAVLAGSMSRGGEPDLSLLCAFYGSGVFVFAHCMHERYLFPAILFLTASWIRRTSSRLLLCEALFSGVMLANMILVQATFDTADPFLLTGIPAILFRAVGFAAAGSFVLLAFYTVRAVPAEKEAPSDAIPAL